MATHPSYDRDARREYQRRYRAEGRDKHNGTGRNMKLPFVGVDGEGGNLASGYHSYFLLRVGRETIRPMDGNVRLSTRQVLEFLDSLPRTAIYVVYFGDYDVTKWLEDLSWTQLEKLVNPSLRRKKDGRGWWPVEYEDFQIDYLPRKEFKVRRLIGEVVDPETGRVHRSYTPWLVVNDVGSFFQCRFVEALEKWDVGTPEEREAIGTGKEARHSFQWEDIEEIDHYNALEIKLLQELMTKFRNACQDVGYIPRKWQGPGLLAEAMFSKHGVSKTKELEVFHNAKYRELVQFAVNAFYGGRPEISAIGPVCQICWQWDINSAYPYAMLKVPCLLHGKWERVVGGEVPDDSELALVYGSFTKKRGERSYWYGLPIRSKDGSISYPESGKGWYWNFEINGAKHQTYRVERSWIYRRECDCRPLSFVSDVYELRRKLGKDGAGIVLKLGLNSLYGKSVQSIGSPQYSNPIWGSFITAYCRRMIQDFLHSSPMCKAGRCGEDVLMIATDSVCTITSRTDMEESKELGGWSKEEHPRGMFLVQPGLYFGSSGKAAKTRGVPRSVIEEYEGVFRDSFQRMVLSGHLEDGDVQVPQRLFCGIKLALQRHNLKLLGQWIEFFDPETGKTGKTVRFDWTTKRLAAPVLNPTEKRTYILTFPAKGDTAVDSKPYDKDIGGVLIKRNSLRELIESQPDWVPVIETGEMSEE